MEITSALVSLAGSHVSSVNSRGVAGISGGVIDQDDIARALDAAQAVAIPHNREIIHVVQRGFTVDGQTGIRTPIGMHGYRLEVEAHIITAGESTVENIRQCVQAAGVDVSHFVLNPLASGEVVLTETEREMGSVVCDIGGGTTDIALYIDGDVWHTMVIPVAGSLITSDIAHGLRLPLSQAEDVKKQYGYAVQADIQKEDTFTVRAFGDDHAEQVSRKDLANIIEARVEEIFQLVQQEIKRSGYDGLAAGWYGSYRRIQPVARYSQHRQPGHRSAGAGRPTGKPCRIGGSAAITRLFHQCGLAALGYAHEPGDGTQSQDASSQRHQSRVDRQNAGFCQKDASVGLPWPGGAS